MNLTVRKTLNPYGGSPANDKYMFQVLEAPASMHRHVVKPYDKGNSKLEPGSEWISEQSLTRYQKAGWNVTIEGE